MTIEQLDTRTGWPKSGCCQLFSHCYRRRKRKRLEFAQKMTLISAIFSMAVVTCVLILNFALLWNGREAMPQETITTVTVYGGITSTLTLGGYCTLTAVRNCSLNKHVRSKENEVEDVTHEY